jgi:hypothetical protein
LGAYWRENIAAEGIKPKDDKSHCFFIEVDFPLDCVPVASIGEFLDKAGDHLELCAEEKPIISARIYEANLYQDGVQKRYGFWLTISDEEFQKILPETSYILAVKPVSGEYQWLIDENIILKSK